MNASHSRPSLPLPLPLKAMVADAQRTMGAVEFWLFGSRARGDARSDSDWDVLAVLPDDATREDLSPVTAWKVRYRQDIPVTLLTTTREELRSIWGLPNTLGYDLASEGVRLVVD